MPEPVLNPELALGFIRGLSGTEHYPFHLEGEKRLAGVLVEFAPAVGHARAVVDEFDGDTCPSVEALRSMCLQKAAMCKCGRALWRHRDLPDCARFSVVDPNEIPRVESERKDKLAAEAVRGLRDSVLLIPGVSWFVCLRIECIRLAGTTGKSEYLPEYERDYPEALFRAQRGMPIDPAYVERRMRELQPHMFRTGGNRVAGMATIEERIAHLDKGFGTE